MKVNASCWSLLGRESFPKQLFPLSAEIAAMRRVVAFSTGIGQSGGEERRAGTLRIARKC